MTTETNNTEIQLTANELEMIKLQREKAEIEAKEKELRRIQELDKRVEDNEKQIVANALQCHKQRQAAELYFLDLQNISAGMFTLEEIKFKKVHIVRDYKKDTEEIYWEKEVEDVEYKIGVVDEKYRIRVYEHLTYSSKWSRTATNNGFKMFLQGGDYKDETKAITSVKTMFKKIESYIEYEVDKKKSVNRAHLEKEMALRAVKSEFPEFDVKFESNWVRSSYIKEGGTYENRIGFTLENGKHFKFSYRMLSINEQDVIKLDLDGWAGFDYVEVVNTINNLKQVK